MIAGIADEIAVMYAGRIVEQGSVDAVLAQPSHPYTAGLIGSLPGASAPGSMLVQIPGTTPDMVDPPPGCAFGQRKVAVARGGGRHRVGVPAPDHVRSPPRAA